ncbi:lysostaphin resistance A-like protein [Petrocella sp. FN5]|uniref:CPBP family intramembrane glutamic endopeptidase n=1 Tax=Petrocella sp. FN5 TaxID=3032002 RepID=UPI003FA6E397
MILLSSFEEVFFRGLLFTNFNKSLSVNRANWLTSLIFMLFHNIINITILFRSMILGYAFAKNNNLFLVIILHIFMNIITMASPENYQYLGGSVFVDLITSISIFFFILWEHIKNKSTNNKDKSLYKC